LADIHGLAEDKDGTPSPMGLRGMPLRAYVFMPQQSNMVCEVNGHTPRSLLTYDISGITNTQIDHTVQQLALINQRNVRYAVPLETVQQEMKRRAGGVINALAHGRLCHAATGVMACSKTMLRLVGMAGPFELRDKAHNSNMIFRVTGEGLGLEIDDVFGGLNAPGFGISPETLKACKAYLPCQAPGTEVTAKPAKPPRKERKQRPAHAPGQVAA
jgi:hypothetical protein